VITKSDLLQFSKRELVKIILSQEMRIQKLERALLAYENAHTPSSKRRKKNTPPREGDRFPGKPRGSNGGGVRIPEPDRVEDHTLDSCPSCGHEELKHTSVCERHVLDLPLKPVECVLHRVHEYECTSCARIVKPTILLPDGVYGPRVQAASTELKTIGLSYEQISMFWQHLGAPSISAPTILSFTKRASNTLSKVRGAFVRSVKNARVTHKDETGFRRDGTNGWCWTSTTQDACVFFIDPSRGKVAAQRLQGRPDQISIVDGYKAYESPRQRCWAHLLRDAKEAVLIDENVKDQVDRLNKFYIQLCKWVKDPPGTQYEPARILLTDITTCLQSRGSRGRKLATLITNGDDDWLTALQYEDVPLTNNHAERMIRPIVLLRKRMGCFRNEHGARFIEIVMSVLTTWRLREINPFIQLTTHLT